MTSITTSLTTVSYQSQSSIIRRPQTAGYLKSAFSAFVLRCLEAIPPAWHLGSSPTSADSQHSTGSHQSDQTVFNGTCPGQAFAKQPDRLASGTQSDRPHPKKRMKERWSLIKYSARSSERLFSI